MGFNLGLHILIHWHIFLVRTRNSLTYNSWWHSSKMLLFLSKNRVRSCCKVFEWPSLRAASAVLWLFSNPLEQMLQKCLATNTIIPKRPTRIHKRIMRQSSTLSVCWIKWCSYKIAHKRYCVLPENIWNVFVSKCHWSNCTLLITWQYRKR